MRVGEEQLMLRLIRAAFAQRRKTLSNCIQARTSKTVARADIDAVLQSVGLEPSIRGERLALDDFRRLANALSSAGIDISLGD
jgi:16S rRNA (adenine1518-N6/adenine1519-N6)-dimethyltransferase